MKRRYPAIFLLFIFTLLSASPVPEAKTNSLKPENALVVYYFHGKRRCVTCQKLESYAKQALDTRFSKELASGDIQWRVMDISKPENQHFIKDFSLVSQSLVLVQEKNGKKAGWKNLDKIWMKVRDKSAYTAYVQESISQFSKADK